MKPLISLIIPVYNVEEYILECLESVKRQTFNDMEVIIVNDGTPDKSIELAKSFIEDNRLENYFILEKENGGLSSARNFGLLKARGEWVFFLDSDDYLEPNCMELLADLAKKRDTDLVIGGYQAYDEQTGKTEKWNDYPLEYGVLPQDFRGLHSFSFCFSRLYKKQIIDDNKLVFDERIEYAEDNAWQFDYNRFVKSYSCTNTVLCTYRINRAGSLTSKLIHPKMKYYIAEHMYRFFDEFEFEDLKKAFSENQKLLRVVWGVHSTAVVNDILDKKYLEAKQKIKMPLTKEMLNNYIPRSKKDKFFIFLFKGSFSLLKFFVLVYYGNFEKLRKSKMITKLSRIK